MRSPRYWAIGMLSAIGLTVGGAAAMVILPRVLPPPIVAVSSLTLQSPDTIGLVMVWTKRCMLLAPATCPTRWSVEVVSKGGTGVATVAEGVLSRLRDTLRYARPTCPAWDTVLVRVRALSVGSVEFSNPGAAKLGVRCRPITAAETRENTAVRDTFPDGNRRVTTGDWGYKSPMADLQQQRTIKLRASKTAADSARTRREFVTDSTAPDSLRNPTADTVTVYRSYHTFLCLLGRNRYTGHIVILDGDEAACERPRAQWESTRSG